MLPPVEQSKDKQGKKELWNTVRSVLSSSQKGPPMQRVLRDEKLPLSYAQQRLWFIELFKPDTCINNIPVAFHLKGSLNVVALEQSLAEIVRRHEVLRTTFQAVDGRAVQVISPDLTLTLLVIDLQEFTETEREIEVQRLTVEEAQQPFNLATGPLLRVKLLRLAKEEYVFMVTMHHIVSDGWSLNVFFQELTVLYTAFSNNKPSPLCELSIQYADFAVWQSEWISGNILETQLSYWKQQLNASTPVLELPTDKARTPVQTYQGAKQFLKLPKNLSDSLKTLSQQEGVTLFMTLLAAFKILLYRYTSQEDIIVGSAIAGRNRSETKGLIGCFVNTLAFRTDLRDNPSFRKFLTQVREVAINAYSHQDLPFEKLVKELQIERDLSRTPLFQVMFALQKTVMQSLELSGLTLIPLEVHNGTAQFDLTLELEETSKGIGGWFEYNTDLFHAATIARMVNHFQTLLEGIVANPHQRLLDLPLLTELELFQLLVEWNHTETNYPHETCIHELFEAQVERTPDAVAVVFSDQQLTYRELNARANKVAQYLQTLGVGPEVLVGICVERSLLMVVGLLGILKAGGAYVPLDPQLPQERLVLMLNDSQLPILLTTENLVAQLPEHEVRLVCLDTDFRSIAFESQDNPISGVKSNNLAYVIYTSGSTGQPKGVEISHSSATNFLNSMQQQPGLTAADILLAVTTISFDIAVLELYLPLIVGAKVVLVSREVASDGRQLLAQLRKSNATVMQATPATWRLLLAAGWSDSPRLKILCGGEALPQELANQLLEKSTCVWNLYGPTETTVWSTVYKVEADRTKDTTSSIGRPIANTQIYLLDSHLQPVPVGVPGELHIGGAGLARGYLHRIELTQQQFIPNPFLKSDELEENSSIQNSKFHRLYKTGDLARYLPDGNIEYLGRMDHQVKIRGFRIELGEVESALAQHPNVQQTVVTAREDSPGNQRLVAYIVPHQQPSPTIDQLRRFLKQQLPSSMVPTAFVMLEAMPKTPNGKVDRRALPVPELSREHSATFAPVRTPIEEMLALIWADVLGVELVGVLDNFFTLGGHSLLATQVISRVRTTMSVELPLRSLFEAPTIADLAQYVGQWQRSAKQLSAPPRIPKAPDTPSPLSFAQQRLWFLDKLQPDSANYNIPLAVRLQGDLKLTALENSLNEIIKRHSALRTNFTTLDGQPIQIIHPERCLTLTVVDLRASETELEIERLLTVQAQRPFDLTNELLVRASLLLLAETEQILLLCMHHIVADAWSIGVLMQELAALYSAECNDLPSPLPELPIQYADFAVWQRQWLQGEVLESQLAYWQQQLNGAPTYLSLPTDRPRTAIQSLRGAYQSFTLSHQLTEALTFISFDIAVLELYLPLIVGAKVVLVSREVASDGRQLLAQLRKSNATVMQATPATWRLLLAAGWSDSPRLKILCGGEALPQELANQLLEKSTCVWNLYGPTETTVWSTVYKVEADRTKDTTSSIGRPIANTQIYLLDSHLQPVPVGVPGELHIGGAGLARGYLHRIELTQQQFIPNPFLKSDELEENSSIQNSKFHRLYKTGDLARYLPDGNIEYLGRMDHQVKIRGFRIELGEVESALAQHPNVQQTVVTAREDSPGNQRLVAYIVPHQQPSPTIDQLRRFLKQQLPSSMVPTAFVMLEAMPKTPNGKVDRRALPVPELSREHSATFAPVRTPIEEMLALIWADVLGVELVGVLDNFFTLGGHSLLATQVISRVRTTMSVELPLRSLFEAPTIADLAQYVGQWQRSAKQLSAPPRIPKAPDTPSPLSFAQQRLWFLDKLQPDSANYNIPLAVRLQGDLKLTALENSLNEIIKRHSALRTNFTTLDGQPIQIIHPERCLTLTVVDLRASETELEIERLLTVQAQRPFDLTNELLVRASLLLLAETEQILLLCMHHIVADAWSIGVLMQELAALYSAECNDLPSPLPELPIQYADFAVWQRQWLQGEVLESQLAYWQQQLNGAPTYLSLPTDRPRTAIQSLRGAYQSFTLSHQLTEALTLLSRREGVTLFMTLLAAFGTLLYRYTGQQDILIGSPIANRNHAQIEGLIGLFVNTLVLRTDFSGYPNFRELLKRVREVALQAYAHQDLPFELLVEALQPERDLRHTPLFQVMFVFQNAPTLAMEFQGLNLTPLPVESLTAKFDLTLSLENTDQGLLGELEYNTDLFDADTITRMVGHFQTLLAGIVTHQEQQVCELPLLTEQERYQLLVEWNHTQTNYPHETCIHQLFEAQVERNPDAVAVVFYDQQLTYGELNARANKIAHYLRSLGVGPGVRVGIYVERSLLMAIALLGILKAGAAYVPLDSAYPQERLSFMLEDASVSVLLTQQQWVEKSKHRVQVVSLDTDWEVISRENQENPNTCVTSDDLAYVIYTSGSTGKPKGVAVPHRAVIRLLYNTNYIKLEPNDKVAQASNASFDAATFEIWGALLHGAQLVVMTKDVVLSPRYFAAYIQKYEISVLFLTTALFNEMARVVPQAFCSVRHLLFGGEAVDPRCVLEVLRNGSPQRLLHVYGPTESTTFSTWYLVQTVPEEVTTLPIGRPISNTQVYVLDQNLQPVPIGVKGELYIGGDGLAQGYINRPELTQEKFIPNPFLKSDEFKVMSYELEENSSIQNSKPLSVASVATQSQNPNLSRLYKTGDIVRILRDGNIEFVGRQDNQVKIRGFRIELGEIEAVLLQHPSVRETVVTITEDVTDDKSIVAYVVQNQNQTLTIAELRRYLKHKLPDYMIPHIVLLNALPLNSNGKVDRRALILNPVRPEPEETFVAPRDELELRLVKIWEKMLGVHPISVRDNFFDLGGHSMLAVRLVAQLEKIYHKNLPLATVFQASTIEKLASVIRQEGWSSPFSSFRVIQPKGSKPPLFCIHVLGKGLKFYRPLVKYLGTEQPLYGLAIPTVDHSSAFLHRVEDLAAHYIKEMQILQPEGPYFLVGMSFGGVVAFEMAQQLVAQGQKVSLLALLDTYAPNSVQLVPIRERLSAHWSKFLQLGPIYIWQKATKSVLRRLNDTFNWSLD